MDVLSAATKAAVFYGAFSLLVAELVAVNLRVLTHFPWAIIGAAVLLGVWVSTLGRYWSRYQLLTITRPFAYLLVYVVLSVVACLAVLVIQGAFFRLRVESLRLSGDPNVAVLFAYALLVPPLGAILEEVTFRGILRRRLVLASALG